LDSRNANVVIHSPDTHLRRINFESDFEIET